MSSRITPPVIRVFLSSTFADMQNERSYFNTYIQPKLSAMCEKRGVSFFSVDLRWGITEEEQMDGQVLPICLSEIDKCRPYFIGIIGNRYGSVVHEITEDMKKTLPWLTGKEGKSITELEMLYGVLDKEIQTKAQNSAFYLRDPQLSDIFFSQTEPEPDALIKLKETVKCNPDICSAVYSSIEQFGELIQKDFERWLDQEYPVTSVAADARKHWYNAEFRRNYIDRADMRIFLDYYLAHDRKPLMLYGEGKRGKTAFLTNWALDQTRSILVNCQSDTVFHYWPSIAFEIVREMKKLEPDTPWPAVITPASSFFSIFGHKRDLSQEDEKLGNGYEKDSGRNETYFVTDQERDSFRTAFVNWMSNLSFANPVNIVINDLETLDDGEARFLTWLPAVLPDNIRIVCSCNDLDTIDNAQTLGWNAKEMPLFIEASAEDYLGRYLKDFGKNLNEGQKRGIITSPLARYPGCLKYIIRFLNRFGSFDNLSEIISKIHIFSDMIAMYSYSYEMMLADFTQEEQSLFLKLLTFMRCNSNALLEQDYYILLSANVPVPAILWSRFRNLLEQLDVVKGEYWRINDPDLRKFIDTMDIDVCAAESALGEFYLDRLNEEKPMQPIERIRYGTENAIFAIQHLKASQDAKLLAKGLMDEKVLFYLCKVDWYIERAGWMHLVLYSDLDVPALIKQGIIENQNRKRDGGLICNRLAQLIPELEYRELSSSFSEMIGQSVRGEFESEDPGLLSPAFRQAFVRIFEQSMVGQFQRVIQQTEELLSTWSDLSYREKTLLLRAKAEAEDHLGLKENCLQTCAQFYFSAVRTADLNLITDALHMYCYSAYYTQDYETAKHFLKKAKKIAALNGNVRIFLSICNVEGMCNNRLHEFNVAQQLFERCVNIWKKVGNEREAASVCVNICNMYHEKGETKRAISFAKEVVEQLKNSPSENVRALIPGLLNNIGQYQIIEDMDDEGEKTLLQVLEDLEGDSYSITAANVKMALAKFYKKKDFTVKAAEYYELAADTYFKLREHKKTVYALKGAFECLKRGNLVEQFRKVYEKWETMFGTVPNGATYFHREMEYTAVDLIRIEALEEQLVVARSEGNLQKEAELKSEIAQLWLFEDQKKALQNLIEVADIYLRLNEKEAFIQTAEEGICWLIRSPSLDEKSLIYFVSLLPPEEQDMVDRWKTMKSISEELQKRCDPHLQWQFQELAQTLLVPTRCVLSVSILSEQLESVLSYCSSDTVESLFNLASKNPKTNRVLYMAASRIDHASDFNKLRLEYIGDKADCLVQKMWNLILLLQLEEDEEAATVSGNLALIYRRRKEKELTFFYHKKSIDLYQKAGKQHDCLIETLNLATAYRDFGAFPKAIALLREALRDAQESKDQIMCGVIAGNLAALLSQHNDYAVSDEEVLQLFETEERILNDGKEYRSLVISLNNQIIHLLQLPTPDYKLIEEKLVKAKSYVDEYQLKEFEKQINKLENLLIEEKAKAAVVKAKETKAPKMEKEKEFLRKRDSWFRPFLPRKRKK